MTNKINILYLVKDLARESGYSLHAIKFYLKIGLIKEVGRSFGSNYRYFNQETLCLLKLIRQLRKQGKSLKEIKDELL